MEQDTKGGLHAVFAPPPGVAPGQMYRHANLGTTPYMQREMLAAGMYSPQTRVENTLRGLYAQSFANDVAGARTQAEHQQALQNYVTNLGKLMYPQFGGLAAMQQSNQQQQQQGGMPIPADSGANISDPLQTGAVFNLVPQQ